MKNENDDLTNGLEQTKKILETVIDFISGQVIKASPEEIEATQVFSKKLVEDFGYIKKQIQTRPQFKIKQSPSGIEKYPVDIAVFNDENKNSDNLYLIVECKRKNLTDGLKQLKIYLGLSSAQIGVWFNGEQHVYLQKVLDSQGRVTYRELPNIPKKGQRVEDIGKYKRSDLKPTNNLKTIFKDMRNHLAGNITGITRDESIAQEIMNILFCKIFDEVNTGLNDEVTFRAGVDEDKEKIKDRIFGLFDKVKDEYNDVFSTNDVINLDADTIVYIVGELQNYCITEAQRDVIGDAFEVFIGPALRGGEGQFFTPRNVVKMAIQMLDPKPGEMIIDPACGSGGFLIVALEKVWADLTTEGKKKGWSESILLNKKRDVATRYFRGLDKDSFLAKVTKAYMAIVGDGRGGVLCENTLKNPKEWGSSTRDKIKLNNFEVLVTNPPFGSKIPVKGDDTLNQYEVGYKWSKDRKNDIWTKSNKLLDKQPPQILFIERCIQLLKPKGRMAIVLPDGILGNVTDGYVRKVILDKTNILAIVDVPSETFLPSTSTKTSLLFLEKREENGKKSNRPIFMAIAEECGHDRRGKETKEDDLPKIAEEYKKFLRRYNA